MNFIRPFINECILALHIVMKNPILFSRMKDGYELGIDDVHILSTVDGENAVTMSISKASKEDIGTYTCTISNSEGSANTSCKLKVSGKLHKFLVYVNTAYINTVIHNCNFR